jgi:competence protein ComEA
VETHRGSESVLHALPAGSTLADLADRLGTKLSLPCASGQALLSGSAWDFSEGDCPSSRPPTDPLLLGAPVDPNLADRSVLESLPGVGPTLAGAILERRDRVGPFRDLEDLDHVRGIGPSTLRRLAPYLKIDESLLPPRAPALPSEAPSVRGSRRTFRPVDLNRANQRALQSLPGIGPAKARAILEDRERRGPFERVEDLARVRGIGPATLKRIAPRAFVSDRSSP